MDFDVKNAYVQLIKEAETVNQTIVNKKYALKITYNIPGDPTPKELTTNIMLPANATNMIVGKLT